MNRKLFSSAGLVFVLSQLTLAQTGCSHMKSSEATPASHLPPVVQQTADPNLRLKNSLYLPNRKIESTEMGSKQIIDTVTLMRQVMHEKQGIGIAANQVGLNLQIFMIEAKPNNPRYKIFAPVEYKVFINPKITRASPERRNFWHGCLSAVGEKRGNVAAYEWIEYEAQDLDGQKMVGRLDGLAAIIFQHEFRHMLGGTYLDRAHEFLDKAAIDEGIDKKTVEVYSAAPPEMPHLLGDYTVGQSLEEFYLRQP